MYYFIFIYQFHPSTLGSHATFIKFKAHHVKLKFLNVSFSRWYDLFLFHGYRRRELRASTSGTSAQFLPANVEQSLVHRQHSDLTSLASSSSKEAILLEDSPPSSPQPRDIPPYTQNNGSADEVF